MCDKCYKIVKWEFGMVGVCGRMFFLMESILKRRNNEEVRIVMGWYKDVFSRYVVDVIVKVSGVRYSEFFCFLYFNIVDNFFVDFMYNLFFGLVEDIGNVIIVGDENFIDVNGW